MELIKNVLVAIDFSGASENVLKNAIHFAKEFSSQITLVHVLPDDITNEKVFSLVEIGAKEQLQKVSDRLTAEGIKTGIPVLSFGNYSDRVVYEADKLDVDLVIIGAGEKAKNDTFQLGSTADRIVRLSKKPVFVVKGSQALDIKNLICPVDFSIESGRALKNAISLSRKFNAKLVILTVCPVFRSTYTLRRNSDFFNDYRQKDHEKEFNHFLEKFDLKNLDYVKKIILGDPALEIAKAIIDYNSDLLLIGTTGKSGISRVLMGSVTEKVIRQVLCSFVTFKNQDAITMS